MTTQAKHTPGPWYVLGDYVSSKSGGEVVCPIKRIRSEDLSLIAAAPDLLAALSRLAVWADHFGPCFCQACDYMPGRPERHKHTTECDLARAAIAKAEGRAGA